MKCLECNELTRVLNLAKTDYQVAMESSYYLVSTEIAAKKQVDMERSRIALTEHEEACVVTHVARDCPAMSELAV